MAALSLSLVRAMVEALERGERICLATVTRAHGSTPQGAGARMLRYADGRTLGTVGGGRIEQAVCDELERCAREGGSRTLVWDLTRDLGMCCGGRMEVFVEVLEATDRLLLFGAGHVGQATARVARGAGFRVCVVDPREELNSEERFGECERLVLEPDEGLRALMPTPRDFVLIATHDHTLDERALGCALRAPHRYIGMIGSRRKVLRVLERLEARHGKLDLSRLYAPVGLAIGALGPEEIAISIVAELIARRRSVDAGHMSMVSELVRRGER
jgi:xanthine dehydrogenase accessory factor